MLMFKALAYLQYHSTKNRVLMRIRRLKQPKYLAGAIVGLLYFYGYFYRYLFGLNRAGAAVSIFADPQNALLYELFGSLALFGILFLAWFFPRDRAALSFS